METAEERLSFAVRFAEMKLDQLRPGDWLNLRDDLVVFLSHQEAVDLREAKDLGSALAPRGGIVARAWKRPKPQEMTEADLRHLQEKTQEFLDYVVEARQEWLTPQELEEDVPPKVFLALSFSVLLPSRFAGRCVLRVEGDTRGVFLATLLFLLTQQPIDKVGKCPEPECGKLFLRVRKQLYCSRRCVNRANQRGWRKTHKGKDNGQVVA